MAIIGILTTIAVPSYRSYVLRTNRAVAKAALSEIATRQEAYFASRKTYATTLGALGYAANTVHLNRDSSTAGASGSESIYTLTLAAHRTSGCAASGSATSLQYTAVAVPQNGQTADTECQALCLTSTTLRLAQGSSSSCWSR